MDTQEALQKAEVILKDMAVSFKRPEENRLDVVISPDNLKAAVKTLLLQERWGYLSAITGLDNPEYEVDEISREMRAVDGKGFLEALYHFVAGAAITTLRVPLPYSNPRVESICDLMPSASIYEREAMELLGIIFEGTPDTSHLILPDGWPEGVYPLRKTFNGLPDKAKE